MASTDFTIADVLVWARTKPAGEEYGFCDAENCALGQYLRAEHGLTGIEIHAADPFFTRGWHKDREITAAFQSETFGELVTRLEALLPAEPLSDTWTKADAYLSDIEAVELA